MHQVVPHFILERYAAGQTRGTFSAVGLFADIYGFSTMTDALMEHGQHGAEVLAEVMRTAFEPLIYAVYGQGGFIATHAGDAFTALFPVDESNLVAHRALAAACHIQDSAASQTSYATPYGEFAVSVKVGVAMGQVSWGVVSSEDGQRAAYYFQGTAVDGCAEAEHRASAGDVILDALLYQRIQDLVRAEAVGEYFRLTGVVVSHPEPLAVDLPQPDIELTNRFLPRQLITQSFGGEFRLVTHLFVNLPTVRTETQLGIFMQSLFELQDRYGGLLNRLDFGDKGSNLLLFWGVPATYENDVQRCLDFILDLQAQTSIPISAGVTYQLAHAGFVGSDLSDEYTCYGRGVNLAARFMGAAARGEIWLDEGAAKRAESHYELDFVGERTLKGFAEKQKVYVLVEPKEESQTFFAGKLVGREAELKELAEFVQPVFKGEYAGSFVIWGEPGIGKSRLVYEFRNSAVFKKESEASWAICQADEVLRQSLNPFRYWLRRYFEQSPEQSEARNKRNFNRKLDELIAATQEQALAAELDHTRSFLGALLDLRWPDSLYEQLDAQGRYENTFIALIALIKAESCQQPVILFIDDAQWMDEDSKSFLPRLARALTADERRTYPIAILATARYEGQAPPLEDALSGPAIHLSGLSTDDLARQAEALLGDPGSSALLTLLAQRSEGNPFFAEQILRYMQEERLLEEVDGGWSIQADDLEDARLPADVRAVLIARLDRLAREVREVVQTAAVLGREFEVKLLASVLRGDEDLPEKIAQAEQADIWTALSELRYFFKHALLRDAAYSMQLHARRQQLHQLAAEALEGLYKDELHFHYGELAFHSERAGLVEPARRYLQLAGEVAQEAYQNSQAVDYYSRAIKLTPDNDLEGRYQLHLARETIHDLQGNRDAQRKELSAMQLLADELEDSHKQIEVMIRQADYLTNLGDYQEAVIIAENAISLSHEAGRDWMIISAYRAAVSPLYKQGEYDAAIKYGETGIALARQQVDHLSEGRVLNLLGLIALDQQNFSTAKTYLDGSLRLFREIGDLRGQSMLLNNLGNLSGFLGDHAAAQDYYEQSLAIAREIGDRAGESFALGNLGWMSGSLGDFATARAYAERMIKIGREVGSRLSELYGLLNLSSYSGASGEVQTSLDCAEQALELARETHDRNGEAWALTYQGHALLALEHTSGAGAAYKSAFDIRQELDQSALATEPCAGLARVALIQGDLSAAQAQVGLILNHLDIGGSLDGTDEPLKVYLTCYSVLEAAHDERAALVLETAHTMLLARANHIQDKAARLAFLEDIPYHRELLAAWDRYQGEGGSS
ncbi:MAG TPA: tetratricopeptide repeat protein [Anaerolineales bacterium]|nr:tetratricopeptide repeat protein [Anaerolineales bacterium]